MTQVQNLGAVQLQQKTLNGLQNTQKGYAYLLNEPIADSVSFGSREKADGGVMKVLLGALAGVGISVGTLALMKGKKINIDKIKSFFAKNKLDDLVKIPKDELLAKVDKMDVKGLFKLVDDLKNLPEEEFQKIFKDDKFIETVKKKISENTANGEAFTKLAVEFETLGHRSGAITKKRIDKFLQLSEDEMMKVLKDVKGNDCKDFIILRDKKLLDKLPETVKKEIFNILSAQKGVK